LQFKPRTQYRRVGLLEPNRFGEYLFDNDKEKILARLKKQGEVYYENKAATTGTSKAQLMRQEGWPLGEARIYDNGRFDTNRSSFNRNNPNSGNGRAPNRGFRGGGRFKTRGRGFKAGRGSNFQGKNNSQWNDNAHDQPSSSGTNNNNPGNNNKRGNPKSNKRQWGGGGRGGNQ
jgi:hypothetical protein